MGETEAIKCITFAKGVIVRCGESKLSLASKSPVSDFDKRPHASQNEFAQRAIPNERVYDCLASISARSGISFSERIVTIFFQQYLRIFLEITIVLTHTRTKYIRTTSIF
jgi:hypothetical protein